MIFRPMVAMLSLAVAAPLARADERLLGDDTFAVQANGDLVVDGGFIVGVPAALGTGLSTGIGAGITRECGCHLSYGARASWSSAGESSTAWTVSHSDFRLRATGAVRHVAGRGSIALRLGVGATVVHEDRIRNQGMRAGLTGSALETRAIDTLPAADLEAVVALRVTGPWLVVVSGGPSLDYLQGGFHGGFTSQLGVAWQP